MNEDIKLYFRNPLENNLDMVINKTNGDGWIFTIKEENHNKNLLYELINEAVLCLDNKSDYQYSWKDSRGGKTCTYKVMVGNDLRVFFNNQEMDTFKIKKADFISLLIAFIKDNKKDWIYNPLPNKAIVSEETFSVYRILFNRRKGEISKSLIKAENLLTAT